MTTVHRDFRVDYYPVTGKYVVSELGKVCDTFKEAKSVINAELKPDDTPFVAVLAYDGNDWGKVTGDFCAAKTRFKAANGYGSMVYVTDAKGKVFKNSLADLYADTKENRVIFAKLKSRAREWEKMEKERERENRAIFKTLKMAKAKS